MSSLTASQALDEIAAMLNTAWLANAQAAADMASVPLLTWSNVALDTRLDMASPWARADIRLTGGEQATLGAVGQRRFERTGLLTVQVFIPLGEGVTRGTQLANVALNAFEGKASPGGVWFRQCGIRYVGRNETVGSPDRPDRSKPDPWDQTQFLCEFNFQELK